MQRYKLTIEYKGTDYAGWQRQQEVASIQQEIEEAIHKFSSQDISITAAGRTDAGVHAWGQVAHADFEPFKTPMEEFEIAKAINAHLRPKPISILKVEKVDNDFHARFSATNKLYHYRIIQRRGFLALDQGLGWHVKKELNVEAMQEAAKHLLGHHDFTSFRDSQCQAKTPMRTLDRLEIKVQDYDTCGGIEIIVATEGKSFLHHQVRNMVGSLALVGEGKWEPEDIKAVLNAKDRTKAGPTAPAEGLYLMQVDY